MDLIRVNRPQEAVEILEGIDPTRGWMKQWLPYWSMLTQARHMLGDHDRELRDARRGREQHSDRLQAFNYEARALGALGRVDEANALFDELLGFPPHPSWGHTQAVMLAGYSLRAHGHSEAAQDVFQLALQPLQTHSPDESSRRSHRYNLAQALYWDEQWEVARNEFAQLVAEAPDNVSYNGHLGVANARLGDVDAASRISEWLAALDRPHLRGSNTRWRARIAAVLGNTEQAMELLRQSFNEGSAYGIGLHRNIDYESLRDYPAFQEFLRPKG